MSSKYNKAWTRIFARVGGLESILNRVRAGEVVSIPAEDIKNYGQRLSWLGRAIISKEGILGSSAGVAAHVNALKNILPKHLLPDEQIECVMSGKGGQLRLHMKLVDEASIRPTTIMQPPTPSLEQVVNAEDLGRFYLLISSFEQELRNFIKDIIGKGFIKRLNNELPAIVNKWREREATDIKWGIEPEEELINYADLTDYIQIIKRYRKIFAANEEELGDVETNLKIFANYGRNPLMHCRTLNIRKFYTTQSAVNFLREWLRRRGKTRQRT